MELHVNNQFATKASKTQKECREEENRLENERVCMSASKHLMSVYGEYLLQISYRYQDLNNSQISVGIQCNVPRVP